MRPSAERVRANVHKASTEDLLDRATVYRAGMEAEALILIDDELRDRGVTRDDIADHERKRREAALVDEKGVALMCCKCRRPAVVRGSAWHFVWGLVPVFRTRLAWCEEHRPKTD